MESWLFDICFPPNDQKIIHFVLNVLENTHVVLIIVGQKKQKVKLIEIADVFIALQGDQKLQELPFVQLEGKK